MATQSPESSDMGKVFRLPTEQGQLPRRIITDADNIRKANQQGTTNPESTNPGQISRRELFQGAGIVAGAIAVSEVKRRTKVGKNLWEAIKNWFNRPNEYQKQALQELNQFDALRSKSSLGEPLAPEESKKLQEYQSRYVTDLVISDNLPFGEATVRDRAGKFGNFVANIKSGGVIAEALRVSPIDDKDKNGSWYEFRVGDKIGFTAGINIDFNAKKPVKPA